jgi:hypothetical protein
MPVAHVSPGRRQDDPGVLDDVVESVDAEIVHTCILARMA